MAWTIEVTAKAEKALAKLNKPVADRITCFLAEKAAQNPRGYGKPLSGSLSGSWSYRAGDYRILAKIENERLVVLVVQVGHRRNVYGGH